MLDDFEEPTSTTSTEYRKIYYYAQRMEKSLLHIIEHDRCLSEIDCTVRDLRAVVPFRGDSVVVQDCLFGLTGEGQGF